MAPSGNTFFQSVSFSWGEGREGGGTKSDSVVLSSFRGPRVLMPVVLWFRSQDPFPVHDLTCTCWMVVTALHC